MTDETRTPWTELSDAVSHNLFDSQLDRDSAILGLVLKRLDGVKDRATPLTARAHVSQQELEDLSARLLQSAAALALLAGRPLDQVAATAAARMKIEGFGDK